MPSARRAPGREIQVTGAVPGAPAPSRGPERLPARRAPAPQRPSGDNGAPPNARRSSDLMQRTLVAVPAVVLAVTFDDLGGVGWMLLMALLALACASELYRMLDSWKPATSVGLLVVAGMCVAAYYGPQYMVGAALLALPLVFLSVLFRGETNGATLTIAATLLGVLWIGFAFSHGVLLRDTHYGKGVMIDVMVGTFLADTAAYIGGRWFGRHLLVPSISPKKTVEGLFCGAIAAILAVFCAGLYQPWLPHGTALIIGLSIAVLGPIGDLFESLVKRDAGAKDAGTMFGAHGGALDRLDAVSFTVIAVYYIWTCLPH